MSLEVCIRKKRPKISVRNLIIWLSGWFYGISTLIDLFNPKICIFCDQIYVLNN